MRILGSRRGVNGGGGMKSKWAPGSYGSVLDDGNGDSEVWMECDNNMSNAFAAFDDIQSKGNGIDNAKANVNIENDSFFTTEGDFDAHHHTLHTNTTSTSHSTTSKYNSNSNPAYSSQSVATATKPHPSVLASNENSNTHNANLNLFDTTLNTTDTSIDFFGDSFNFDSASSVKSNNNNGSGSSLNNTSSGLNTSLNATAAEKSKHPAGSSESRSVKVEMIREYPENEYENQNAEEIRAAISAAMNNVDHHNHTSNNGRSRSRSRSRKRFRFLPKKMGFRRGRQQKEISGTGEGDMDMSMSMSMNMDPEQARQQHHHQQQQRQRQRQLDSETTRSIQHGESKKYKTKQKSRWGRSRSRSKSRSKGRRRDHDHDHNRSRDGTNHTHHDDASASMSASVSVSASVSHKKMTLMDDSDADASSFHTGIHSGAWGVHDNQSNKENKRNNGARAAGGGGGGDDNGENDELGFFPTWEFEVANNDHDHDHHDDSSLINSSSLSQEQYERVFVQEQEQGQEQDQDQGQGQDQYERQHSSLDESGFNTSSLSQELYEQDFVRQQAHDDWQPEPHSNLQFDTFHEAEVAAIARNANPPVPIKTEYSHDVIAEAAMVSDEDLDIKRDHQDPGLRANDNMHMQGLGGPTPNNNPSATSAPWSTEFPTLHTAPTDERMHTENMTMKMNINVLRTPPSPPKDSSDESPLLSNRHHDGPIDLDTMQPYQSHDTNNNGNDPHQPIDVDTMQPWIPTDNVDVKWNNSSDSGGDDSSITEDDAIRDKGNRGTTRAHAHNKGRGFGKSTNSHNPASSSSISSEDDEGDLRDLEVSRGDGDEQHLALMMNDMEVAKKSAKTRVDSRPTSTSEFHRSRQSNPFSNERENEDDSDVLDYSMETNSMCRSESLTGKQQHAQWPQIQLDTSNVETTSAAGTSSVYSHKSKLTLGIMAQISGLIDYDQNDGQDNIDDLNNTAGEMGASNDQYGTTYDLDDALSDDSEEVKQATRQSIEDHERATLLDVDKSLLTAVSNADKNTSLSFSTSRVLNGDDDVDMDIGVTTPAVPSPFKANISRIREDGDDRQRRHGNEDMEEDGDDLPFQANISNIFNQSGDHSHHLDDLNFNLPTATNGGDKTSGVAVSEEDGDFMADFDVRVVSSKWGGGDVDKAESFHATSDSQAQTEGNDDAEVDMNNIASIKQFWLQKQKDFTVKTANKVPPKINTGRDKCNFQTREVEVEWPDAPTNAAATRKVRNADTSQARKDGSDKKDGELFTWDVPQNIGSETPVTTAVGAAANQHQPDSSMSFATEMSSLCDDSFALTTDGFPTFKKHNSDNNYKSLPHTLTSRNIAMSASSSAQSSKGFFWRSHPTEGAFSPSEIKTRKRSQNSQRTVKSLSGLETKKSHRYPPSQDVKQPASDTGPGTITSINVKKTRGGFGQGQASLRSTSPMTVPGPIPASVPWDRNVIKLRKSPSEDMDVCNSDSITRKGPSGAPSIPNTGTHVHNWRKTLNNRSKSRSPPTVQQTRAPSPAVSTSSFAEKSKVGDPSPLVSTSLHEKTGMKGKYEMSTMKRSPSPRTRMNHSVGGTKLNINRGGAWNSNSTSATKSIHSNDDSNKELKRTAALPPKQPTRPKSPFLSGVNKRQEILKQKAESLIAKASKFKDDKKEFISTTTSGMKMYRRKNQDEAIINNETDMESNKHGSVILNDVPRIIEKRPVDDDAMSGCSSSIADRIKAFEARSGSKGANTHTGAAATTSAAGNKSSMFPRTEKLNSFSLSKLRNVTNNVGVGGLWS